MKGILIKEFLTDKGFKKSLIANDIGISPQHLNNILNSPDITTSNIEKISNAININLFSLFNLNSNKLTTIINSPKNIKKTSNSVSNKGDIVITKEIPLIPIDAIAKFNTVEFQIKDYEIISYVIPDFRDLNIDFMIRVNGNSMHPRYNNGDVVACKNYHWIHFSNGIKYMY